MKKKTSESVLRRRPAPPNAHARARVAPSTMGTPDDPGHWPRLPRRKFRLTSRQPRRNGGPIANRTVFIGLHTRPFNAIGGMLIGIPTAMVVAAGGMSEMQQVMDNHVLPLHDMGSSPKEKTEPSQSGLHALHAGESSDKPSRAFHKRHRIHAEVAYIPRLSTFVT